MDYYVVKINFPEKNVYCIWFSARNDEFITVKEKVVTFDTEEQARRYGDEKRLSLRNEILPFDAQLVMRWVDKAENIISYKQLMGIWSLCSDVAYCTKGNFYGDANSSDITAIYDKLFYALNLPFTKSDENEEDYLPKWSEKELYKMRLVLKNGYNLLKTKLQCFAVK